MRPDGILEKDADTHAGMAKDHDTDGETAPSHEQSPSCVPGGYQDTPGLGSAAFTSMG